MSNLQASLAYSVHNPYAMIKHEVRGGGMPLRQQPVGEHANEMLPPQAALPTTEQVVVKKRKSANGRQLIRWDCK